MELSPEHEQVRETARQRIMAYIAGLVVKEEADE